MKRLSHSQLQNLIFIGVVMLVAAAAIVYMLLREDLSAASGTELWQTPLPSPTDAEKGSPAFEAAPLSVLLAQLEGDDALTLREKAELRYALSPSGNAEAEAAELRLTESKGRVSSLMWIFPMPPAPPDKPASEIEKRLAEDYGKALSAMRGSVETLLFACIKAGDMNGLLREPILRAWCDGALAAMENGKSYRNVSERCTFTAYAAEEDGAPALVCALLLP